MEILTIVVSVVGILGTLSSIFFACIALKKTNITEEKKDSKTEGIFLSDIGYIKACVDRVEKKDSHHVRFYFKKGVKNRELPLILSQFKIFSKKQYKDKDFATPSLDVMLGSGPYTITSFEPNKFVELKRNKDYWGKNLASRKGYFNFDTIRFDFYQDTTVTLQALFSGAIDAREEYIAKSWSSGYDNKLVKEGQIIKEEIQHKDKANINRRIIFEQSHCF